MRLRVVIVSLVTAAVGLTAAGVAASRPATTQRTLISVTATEFKFVLSKKVAAQGSVFFTVVNKGKLPHDFWIAGKKTKLLRPGKSASLVVELTKGSKPYKCTVSGHAKAGMKGTLRVT
jgi:uncharacterized cupredoxin-like copper-binding protein